MLKDVEHGEGCALKIIAFCEAIALVFALHPAVLCMFGPFWFPCEVSSWVRGRASVQARNRVKFSKLSMLPFGGFLLMKFLNWCCHDRQVRDGGQLGAVLLLHRIAREPRRGPYFPVAHWWPWLLLFPLPHLRDRHVFISCLFPY